MSNRSAASMPVKDRWAIPLAAQGMLAGLAVGQRVQAADFPQVGG